MVGDDAWRLNASCVETDDFPTPPFPEQTMMMCLTDCSRRETGVSCTVMVVDSDVITTTPLLRTHYSIDQQPKVNMPL